MLHLLIVALLLQQGPQQLRVDSPLRPAVMQISGSEAARHLVGEEPVIRRKTSKPYMYGVSVSVMVNTQGNVTFARVPPEYSDNVPPDLIHQAENLAGALRFTEFRHKGRAVPVVFGWYVRVLPPERMRPRTSPIKVKDWNTVRIKLERTGCGMGFCPDYSIEVRGDGSVAYHGKGLVGTVGVRTGPISQANLTELIWVIEQANYYSLQTRHGSCGWDGADAFLFVAIDGRVKRVKDCGMIWMASSESLRRIEEAIDRLSGAERWLFPLYMDNPELDP